MKAETRIDRSPAADGQPVTAILLVSPGERYRLGSIAVQADATVPPQLVGLAFSIVGMVLGSLVPRAAVVPATSHDKR